jgi:hypothetical protein
MAAKKFNIAVRCMVVIWLICVALASLFAVFDLNSTGRSRLPLIVAITGPIWFPIGLAILAGKRRMDESMMDPNAPTDGSQ